MAVEVVRGGRVEPAREKILSWKPIGEGNRLTFENNNHAAVKGSLFATFGEFPIRLSKSRDIVILRAMASTSKMLCKGDAPYNQLIEALNKYGEIEVADA